MNVYIAVSLEDDDFAQLQHWAKNEPKAKVIKTLEAICCLVIETDDPSIFKTIESYATWSISKENHALNWVLD